MGAEAFAALPFARAKELVLKLVLDREYVEFLTLPAYDWIVANEAKLG